MAIMRVMKMLIDQIINVVAMRHCLVAAAWAVNVLCVMLAAVMTGSASNGVLLADRNHMRCYLTVIFLVAHFSLVEIIDVTFVLDLHVPAIRAVNVTAFRR